MRIYSALLVALLHCQALAQPFLVDGAFDDWPLNAETISDPAGDATGQLDATAISGVIDGDSVLLSLSITKELNLQSGSSSNPDLKLVLDGGGISPIEIRFRGRKAIQRSNGQTLTWESVRYSSAPTVAATRFEIRVDLSAVGGVIDGTATVQLEGSDTLTTPLVIHASAPAGPPTPGLAPTPHKRSLRLVSLNTLRTGLFDNGQAPHLHRLLTSANAGVYLLQEEYNSSSTQIESLFNSLMPLGIGQSWHVHKRGDTAVVARWPITALPNYDSSYAVCAVLAPDGPIVVISQHPKCCGYIGSSEDQRRIEQAGLTAQIVEEVRAGQFDGAYTLSDAPVIIGGDWNLVGSRGPLDRLTEPELPGIRELTITNRGRSDVTTWRELDGLGFPPGRLDLIVFDANRLTPIDAQVFDTAFISPERLATLGLQPDDSTGSDHLMLIADFMRDRAGD